MILIFNTQSNDMIWIYYNIFSSKSAYKTYASLRVYPFMIDSKIKICYSLLFQNSNPEYYYLDNQKDIFNK